MTVPLCANFNNLVYITREQEHSKFPRGRDWDLRFLFPTLIQQCGTTTRVTGAGATAIMSRGIQYEPCVLK